MFDERSFSKESFDERSWFFGWVAATVTRWIKTFSVVKQESEKFVTKPDNTIYITKAR